MSSYQVSSKIIDLVGDANRKVKRLKQIAGIYGDVRRITYEEMVFIDCLYKEMPIEEAALTANPLIKHKSTARRWGMTRLEKPMIRKTIALALEENENLSTEAISNKLGNVFKEAVTVSDVVKVAEYVSKVRGEYAPERAVNLNVGVGVSGDSSLEEIERQIDILTGGGEAKRVEQGSSISLDEVALRGREETGATEL